MVKQILAYRDMMHEGIHGALTSSQMNISLGALFPRLFKSIDVYVDASRGELTIDNLRAAAYRSNYTPNDCKAISEIVEKFVHECNVDGLKQQMSDLISGMDASDERSIRDVCDKITEAYDLYARYGLAPQYSVYKWNDQFQYITKCGAMSYDSAKARNLKLLAEDKEYNRAHRMHVSMADIALYKNDTLPAPVHDVRDLIVEVSKACPDVKVSYVPNEGLDIFIFAGDTPRYIPLQVDFKDLEAIGTRAIKAALDKADDITLTQAERTALNSFMRAYKHESGYRYRVSQFEKLQPPVAYTREQYEADIKKEEKQAETKARQILRQDSVVMSR